MDIQDIVSPTERELILASVDIAGFSRRSAAMSDPEVFRLLDRFYHLIDRAARAEGGIVVKYMGDAALLVFDASAALGAHRALRRIRTQSRDLFETSSADTVVVARAHVGSVMCGPIGPEERFDVIGDAVNTLFMLGGGGSEIYSPAFCDRLTE